MTLSLLVMTLSLVFQHSLFQCHHFFSNDQEYDYHYFYNKKKVNFIKKESYSRQGQGHLGQPLHGEEGDVGHDERVERPGGGGGERGRE